MPSGTEPTHEASLPGGEPGEPVAPPPLTIDQLRWRCHPEDLTFRTTADLEPITGIAGQEAAVTALQYGLETRAAGQNIFVRGLTGTGRMTLVRRLLEEMKPCCPSARDHCYVHNFEQSDRPRLISLPRGRGTSFRRLADELADFIRTDLQPALSSESVSTRRSALDQVAEERVRKIIKPFEEALSAAGLALVHVNVGPLVHSVLFPVVEGKPVPPEKFQGLHEEGSVSDDEFQKVLASQKEFQQELPKINERMHEIRREHAEAARKLVEQEARVILGEFVKRLRTALPYPDVEQYITDVVEDVVEQRLGELGDDEEDFTFLYRVNLLSQYPHPEERPIIVENTPTLGNLLGGVDREVGPMGMSRSDHLMIRAGSLLRADGGYLILDARDVLTETGAWKVLVRTLRTGRLEIIPPEFSLPWLSPTMKPEPIDIDVKVILMGDAETFHLLDAMDPDFPQLFKVLADFDSVMPRNAVGIQHYAGVLTRITREEGLLPLDRTAVASLAEHGARVAGRSGKLTARFGRVADLAREASFIATKDGRDTVMGTDVDEAVKRTRKRAELPSRRFRELLADGTIRVQTRDRVIGQINGLAVLHAGPLTYGFPARITATIGPGSAGVINIEREAALSGAIHTKGFYILGGLLRCLLQTDHPLAFDASVAFEQSYGGIDGDSASGAEICCLLSALTNVPLRQDLAMTGAIDQMGNILAIGAANEKIEGFFETCRDIGLTGTQGVILPRSNADDLMLRQDVIDACAAGSFQVYAVDRVHEALTLLTGRPAGARNEAGQYPAGTLLALAVERAHEFWLKAAPPGAASRRMVEQAESPATAPPRAPAAGDTGG